MKYSILIVVTALLFCASDFINAQTTNDKISFEDVYGTRRDMGTMPKEKENLLLTLYDARVKEKLEELKKLSINEYQKMLWRLVVYVPSDFNGNDKLLNEVVITRGPASYNDIRKELLKIDVEILAIKIKNSNPHSSNELKNELTSALYQLFDYSTLRRQTRLQRLEEQLTELKNTINTLNNNRDEIVNAKLNELLK
jgi:hypothetical protein